jgi:hypothetical protein
MKIIINRIITYLINRIKTTSHWFNNLNISSQLLNSLFNREYYQTINFKFKIDLMILKIKILIFTILNLNRFIIPNNKLLIIKVEEIHISKIFSKI